jgi:hypothetical protein
MAFDLGSTPLTASPSSPVGASPNLGVNTSGLGGISSINALLQSVDVAATKGRNLPWDTRNSNVVSPFFNYVDIDACG